MAKRKVECPFCAREIAFTQRETLLYHNFPGTRVPCNGTGEPVSDIIRDEDAQDRFDSKAR